MPRQGLTRKDVLQATFQLIDEKGFAGFSMNELARRLNIRPASLYNHIENESTLLLRIGRTAEERLAKALSEAARDLIGREALIAMAAAWRGFALDHPGLYAVAMRAPSAEGAWRRPAYFSPVEELTGDPAKRDLFLSVLHGAATLEDLSVFSPDSDGEERFDHTVNALADLLIPSDGKRSVI